MHHRLEGVVGSNLYCSNLCRAQLHIAYVLATVTYLCVCTPHMCIPSTWCITAVASCWIDHWHARHSAIVATTWYLSLNKFVHTLCLHALIQLVNLSYVACKYWYDHEQQ